jgi:phosphoribosylformylglycinamidine synthase
LQQSVAKPRVGVVVFPGSNDDRDALEALDALGADAVPVWHGDAELPELDGIVLPGGFSYGDYLRAGAIARFSPAMRAVGEFAATGGLVLGICNGFQVLCEAGLLPGALRPNTSLSFVCRDVTVIVERTDTPFTARCERGQELVIPVKHGEGCYVPPPGPEGHVVLRYAAGDNPNGSIDDVAGVTNQRGNVMGLMPHPEHAVDPLLGSADGALILGAFVSESKHARESRVLGERTA